MARQLLLVVGLGCGLAAGCGPRGTGEPVWVGHLAPLSGPNRAWGEQARQGIQLAVNERVVDKTGSGRPIKVIHVDSRGDVETVRAETVRLLTVNRVAALVGSLDGALAERLVREAQPYAVPVLLTGEAAGDRGPSVFCLGVSAASRGRLLAQQAQKRKVGKVAVLSDSRLSLAADLVAAFVKEYRKDGGGAVKEWALDDRKDEAGLAAEVGRWGPDAVLLAAGPRTCLDWGRRLKEARVKATLFYGGEDVGPAALLPNTTELSLELATVFAPAELPGKGREWAKKYAEAYGEAPDYHAAQAYDAARLLFEAVQQGPAAGTLAERLGRSDDFDSLTGPLRFKDRQTRRKVFLLELDGQAGKLIRSITPEAG